MDSIIYLLQVCACTAVFYLFYYLFLTRLTFFVTNRWYLLVTVVLSFIIPLIKIQVSQPHVYTGVVEHVVYQYTSKPEQVTPIIIHADAPKPQPIHWGTILKYTYILAVLGLTIHLLVTLFAFFKRMKGKRVTKVGKVNILSGNDKIVNGSFLNYIFLNDDELSPNEIQQIIAHEMLHVKLYHSVDRIIVKIAQIVLWFNPFIYLYARSVEENHEFEVDRAVARQTDKHNYANLLVHLSVAGQGMLYHNFSKVPLKKRITMLFNQPSANMKKIVYVLVVPVVLISCLAFARLKSRKYDLTKKLTTHANTTLKNTPTKITVRLNEKTADVINSDAEKNGDLLVYTRTINRENNGKIYDDVRIKRVGSSVGTEVAHDASVGFFVDRDFYTEEQFKKLPGNILSAITKNGAVGVEDRDLGEGFSDLIKQGFKADWDKYTVIFQLYNKTKMISPDSVKRLRALELGTGKVIMRDVLIKAGITDSRLLSDSSYYNGRTYTKETVVGRRSPFFTRTHWQNDDQSHDNVTFNLPEGPASANLGVKDKMGVFIDGRFYNEAAILKLSTEITSKLVIDNDHPGFDGYKMPKGSYAIPFKFKTNIAGTSVTTGNVPTYIDRPAQQNKKQTIDRYPAKDKAQKNNDNSRDNLTDKEKIANLFTRSEVKKASGATYDEVVSHSGGSWAKTEIKHNGKVGFYIDRDFYSEEAFNKVPDKIKLILANKGEAGVCDGPDFSPLVKKGYNANMKGYDAVFYFGYKMDLMDIFELHKDTIRKSEFNPKLMGKLQKLTQLSPEELAYRKTNDYRVKKKLSDDIYHAGLITVKITADKDKRGIIFTWNGHRYIMETSYGQEKVLNKLLKPGDEVQMKVFETGWRKENALVAVGPAFINKNNQKIFQLAEADKLPTTPFLYEANQVRYADGQISNIKKYPNGKWKSALFETVNGYKFYLTFKPGAPAMKGIEWGDHVRLRFVHEVSNGDKTYSIADWVSIAPDSDGYGIRNPELFDKYYQEEKTAAVPAGKPATSNVAGNKETTIATNIAKMEIWPLQLTATDSAYDDAKNNVISLYNATVSSAVFKLKAAFVRVDRKNHIIYASGRIDPKTKRYTGVPFVQTNNDGKSFNSDSVVIYNDKLILSENGLKTVRKLN